MRAVCRRAAILLALLAAPLAAGCGRERLAPPDVTRPAALLAPVERTFPSAGVRLTAPPDLGFDPAEAPLVTSASSGSMTVSVWRYPRTEPLPAGDPELDQAQKALLQEIRRRDPRFALTRARRVEIDGARAIEVVGTQRVGGRERRVRSTHVYAKGAEFVIDAYAAPRDFPAVDRAFFDPLLRSVKIDPPSA